MKCRELMKTELQCATPHDTAASAARRMRENNIGFLPVCDKNNKVVGVLTDRDIAVRLVADDKPASTPVLLIMSKDLISCSPEDGIRHAEELMGLNHKSRILCLDEKGKLQGVISLSDIAQAEEDERAARTLREVSEREAPAIH